MFLSPHKFAGGPRRPASSSPSARSCAAACRRCRAAGRSCSSARPDRAITRIPRSARRRARRRSSSRSAPGSCSRSRKRSAPRRSAGARAPSPGGRSRPGGENPQLRDPRQPGARAARDRLARRPPPARDGCTRTSSSRVLSDLFGIQARSGCFCAGPYIHRMLPDRRRVVGGDARAGACAATWARRSRFSRVSFNYFISEAVFDYIVEAVHLIASDGWKLLPLYRFDVTDTVSGGTRRPHGRRSRSLAGLESPTRFRPRPRARSPRQLEEARRIMRRPRPAAAARIEAAAIRPAPLVPAPGRGVRPGRSAWRRRHLRTAGSCGPLPLVAFASTRQHRRQHPDRPIVHCVQKSGRSGRHGRIGRI